jgi:hypothetical protein
MSCIDLGYLFKMRHWHSVIFSIRQCEELTIFETIIIL